MNDFLFETEPKLFCLLIIAFLYFFQTQYFQPQCIENKLLYFFSLTEILFSILGDVISKEAIQNLCFAVCGASSFLATWFCCKYTFKISKCNATILKKFLCTFLCITSGILSFCTLSCGLNTASFVLVFVIIVMFVIEQNNKIKVDNLTKLYNRYGMDVELKEQLKQYEREHSDSFYIIACDLDNFKYINDTWGHPEGDRALILVAGALARVGKKFSANVFRIGGDEFVIITDTSEEGLAIDVTNAIKTELDNIDFRNDYDIEMSIGVALYDGVTPIDELLGNADKKLYEAKKKIK
ncbi:MAG: GGDEF domain-containing protein [Ruminococcaceae bacterium]|nr:GGDEF domain-containing protein [Oscillospiraceae bacterium]